MCSRSRLSGDSRAPYSLHRNGRVVFSINTRYSLLLAPIPWYHAFMYRGAFSYHDRLYRPQAYIQQHVVFMHKHAVCHLDISLRNLVTDYKGHYASIDFELSRRYEGERYPRIRCARGTELPPEVERGEWSDPFKVDIWALGVLILRACDVSIAVSESSSSIITDRNLHS